MPSRATHIVTNCRISLFFYGWIIFHFIHTHTTLQVCSVVSNFMEFSRQNYWNRLLFPPPGDLPHPGIKPMSLASPALVGGFLTTEPSVCVYVVAQLCPAVCNFVDSSLPGSFVHADSPGKNTGVGCHALLQGIFPTQGLNPGLPRFRQILYHLSQQGGPWILEWVASRVSSCIAGAFFTSWATQEALWATWEALYTTLPLFFIHSSADGHLATLDNAAVNMRVQVSL